MNTAQTAIALIVCIAAALAFGWMGARPPNFKKGPRMIPWRLLMMLAVALSTIFLVHLVMTASGRS